MQTLELRLDAALVLLHIISTRSPTAGGLSPWRIAQLRIVEGTAVMTA